MGVIYAELELINAVDLGAAKRHILGEEEIRRTWANMLVDTGSMYTCINEYVCELLQLSISTTRKGVLADGTVVEYGVAGPIEIRFKNRVCVTNAMVLPGTSEMLLGAITMEDLDVIINPQRRELIVNPAHPDMAVMLMK